MSNSPREEAGRKHSASDGPRTGDDPLSALVTRQIEAMADAWRRGERPRSEDFLARHPELRDEDAVRLIYEEACLRQEEGETSVSSVILRRFPRYRAKLALLLDCNRLLWSPPETEFPEVGADLGDFHLLDEIGRGAHGRTYLATQGSLADRTLVLKITPLGHEEHLSLARLQHMHIVPLYFEQVLPERNVRVLGMPYLGGATLDRILAAIREVPAEQRTGRHLLDALDRCGTALRTEHPTSGPFRESLAQASYTQAVCWIGTCMADALQYAHDRGLVHMDVKPSNVLIAGDGQPMLLDFHLARGPVGPGDAPPDRLGGTPDFMSPEQRGAMEAVRQGGEVAVAVDGRTDIYSLGLVLCEALGGGGIGCAATREAPGSSNLRVSPGLADILRKCLAREPAARYPDAAALALDLRLHLSDRPLRGVANRSPVERWKKWRRRRPAALARGLLRLAVFASLLALLAVAVEHAQRRTRQVEAALAEGRGHWHHRRYSEATLALSRGLKLAGHLPDDDGRKRALGADLRSVMREQAAAELHDLVNLLRFRFGINPPSDEAHSLFLRGRAIWERRGLLTRPGGGSSGREAEQKIRTDLFDLAMVLAELRAPGETRRRAEDESTREAVQILVEAKEEFGPVPALVRDLRAYDRNRGQSQGDGSDIASPRTAWDHYDMGRSYLRSGEYEPAEEEFRQAIALEPGEFWPHFFRGVCAYRLGRPQDALAALNICVALAPRTAECYYNRAKVYEALGEDDEALADDSRALALNPAFASAALNRGILSLRGERYAQAIADFELARASATGPRSRGLIDYNLALVHVAREDWPTAKACLRRAIEEGDVAARDLYARLARN